MIVFQKHDEMSELIQRFEGEVYSEWTQSVDEVAKGNLEKPLLVRDPSNMLITVNFDPKVMVCNIYMYRVGYNQ